MSLGYAFAGGLMFAASVYNLLTPAIVEGTSRSTRLWPVSNILFGLLLGCAFIWWVEKFLTPERLRTSWLLKPFGSRMETLVFVAMFFHSVPEGVAVGVGYGAETHSDALSGLGLYIAVAIAIHNIPEGLAVALPMRARGASIWKCFWFAVLTSIPQPIAAVPASMLVWLFEPLMLPLLGFAAGAMMYLVIDELIPEALENGKHTAIEPSCLVQTDDEIRIYSSASQVHHGRGSDAKRRGVDAASITLHTLRKDGLTFLESDGDQGRFISKPLFLLSSELIINASAPHGEIRFQLTDMESRPVEGFTHEESVPLTSDDAMSFKMRWKQHQLDEVKGKILRLEIKMRHARLYAIRGHFHFIDAQDRSLIQDGQTITV